VPFSIAVPAGGEQTVIVDLQAQPMVEEEVTVIGATRTESRTRPWPVRMTS